MANVSSSNGLEKYPKLRFKGFSEPWHEIVIGDLFKVTRGYVLPTTAVKGKPQDEYVFPVYSSQTKDEGLMGYYNQYLYENAITWTTDGANAGTVHFRDGKFYCTNVCGVLLNEDGNANRCIAEILGSISKKYVSYVGNPKLMNNVMSEIRIHIPSVAEQKKIDELISALDLRIVKQRELIEHLKKYKRGLSESIFSTLSCPTQELSDVCNIVGGGTPDTGILEYWNGDISWFTPTEVGKKKYVISSSRKITEEGLCKSSAKILPPDTVLLTSRATLGEMSLTTATCCTNQGFQSLVAKKDVVLPEYLYYLQTIIKPWCEKYSSGNTFREISKKALGKCTIPVPSIMKQKYIVDCLSLIDSKIEKSESVLEKLLRLKSALLQQLYI